MNIEQIQSLEDIKGTTANAVTLYMDMKYNNTDFFEGLKSYTDNGKGRRGDLYIELYDFTTKQSVKIHSRQHYNIDIQMMEYLESNGLKFQVSTGER